MLPWCTPFSILNQAIVPCPVLTNCCFLTWIEVYQEAGKVVWYSHLFENFPQFVLVHTVKGSIVVNEAEVDVFLEFPCFFYDPMNVGNLISGSFAFSKSSLYIWKFLVHVLQKPNLKILSITLLAQWAQLHSNLSILWNCLSLGVEWKLTFSSPVAVLNFPNLLAYWM